MSEKTIKLENLFKANTTHTAGTNKVAVPDNYDEHRDIHDAVAPLVHLLEHGQLTECTPRFPNSDKSSW